MWAPLGKIFVPLVPQTGYEHVNAAHPAFYDAKRKLDNSFLWSETQWTSNDRLDDIQQEDISRDVCDEQPLKMEGNVAEFHQQLQ